MESTPVTNSISSAMSRKKRFFGMLGIAMILVIGAVMLSSPQNIGHWTGSVTEKEKEKQNDKQNEKPKPTADLSITREVPPTVAGADLQLSYVVTVRNAGPKAMKQLKLLQGPVSLDLKKSTSDDGKVSCDQSKNNIKCELKGSIDAGATRSFTMNFKLRGQKEKPNCSTVYAIPAMVIGDLPENTIDPDMSNNVASDASVTVDCSDITADQSTSIDARDFSYVTPGTAEYTMTTTNNGPSASKHTHADFTYPAGFTFKQASVANCTDDKTNHRVRCIPGNAADQTEGVLSVNQSDSVTLTFTLDPGIKCTNVTSATEVNVDPAQSDSTIDPIMNNNDALRSSDLPCP